MNRERQALPTELLIKQDMRVNVINTKRLILSSGNEVYRIELNGQIIEQVKSFRYLRAIIEENCRTDEEIDESLRDIPKSFKTEVIKKIVRPTINNNSE